MQILRAILLPFSWLYALILRLRHMVYDAGWLKSREAVIPAVVIGNLSLGGTGKTPFTLWLCDRLKKRGISPAVLSRGYGRRTKGFRWVMPDSDATDVGDEPLLMKRKNPDLPVAVCANRLSGAERIAGELGEIDVVVLDDAFQHRQLKAQVNILLTPFARPFWNDRVIPSGTLRDIRSAAARAHAVIVTGCPEELSGEVRKYYLDRASRHSIRHLFFAGLHYFPTINLRGESTGDLTGPVIAFCGIARPDAFRAYVTAHFDLRKFRIFPDHHRFSEVELRALLAELATFDNPNAALVTTEKDAMRLRLFSFLDPQKVIVVPVGMKLLGEDDRLVELVHTAVVK